MKKNVIEVIKENLIEIIPELENTNFSVDDTFTELGANSVDRGELITLTLEKLEMNVPRIEFVSAQTTMDLTNLIIEKYDIG